MNTPHSEKSQRELRLDEVIRVYLKAVPRAKIARNSAVRFGPGPFSCPEELYSAGQWWVAISNSAGATNQLWNIWSAAVTWDVICTGDFNNDGRLDIAGRVHETGQWWVAVSNGSQYSNELWTTWSTDVTWMYQGSM